MNLSSVSTAQRWSLSLNEQEQPNLQTMRDHHPEPYVRERSAAVLKIAEGKSPHWVAKQGRLKERDPDTVDRWVQWYVSLLLGRPDCPSSLVVCSGGVSDDHREAR